MPIRKFSSIEAMDAARRELWSDAPDAAYFQRVAALWERSSEINPRTLPKGVFKFRNLEEAQEQRARLLSEHVQELWQRRAESGQFRIVQKGRRNQAEPQASRLGRGDPLPDNG